MFSMFISNFCRATAVGSPRLVLMRTMCAALGLVISGSWAQTASPEAAPAPVRTDNPHDAIGLSTLPSVVRVNAERIRLPGRENMGLLGTSYLLQVAPNIYVGPAAYGAFTGQRGGFFTVGVEASVRRAVSEFLDVEVGLYAGGGGGGAAPVGGGLMLRSHADLTRDFGNYRAGVSLSQVRFPNGQIRSNQLGLVWSTHTDFRYISRGQLSASGSSSNASIIGRTGMGFDRVQAVAGFYSPRPGVTRISGAPLTAKIGLVGVRMERALTDNNYWGIEAAGAGSGGVAGYAEYLATLGTERAVWADHLVLGVRGAAGMGGGGDVSVGGGLLLKGAAYGIVRLTRDMGLTLEGGYTTAPQGKFRALHATAALNLILDDPYDTSAPARTTRSEWVGGVSRYKAARKDGTERDLDAVTMKVNRFVSNNFYVTGQAHSAFAGGAGGYSVGLFGVGTQWPVFARTRVGAEFLAGAAGGGGVETRGGSLVQPMAYVDFEVTKQLSLRLSGGKVKSLRGPFNSNVIDLSVAFPFGVTSHAYR
jgi:hypothetical protein